MLLRQKLLEQKAASAKQTREKHKVAVRTGQSRTVEAIDAKGNGRSGRAVVEALLTNHFGAEIINEAAFQQVVDQVTETLEADAEGRNLLATGMGKTFTGRP